MFQNSCKASYYNIFGSQRHSMKYNCFFFTKGGDSLFRSCVCDSSCVLYWQLDGRLQMLYSQSYMYFIEIFKAA